MTRVVAFSDLDDTLFQTLPKCPAPKCPGAGDLEAAAFGRGGEPLSFMTPAQSILFFDLLESAYLVPVTARSREAFSRVRLPFPHGAILDFGGVVLSPDGSVDLRWRSEIAPKAAKASPILSEALAEARKLVERGRLSAKPRIIEDDGLPFYLLAKTDPGALEELSHLSESLAPIFEEDLSVYLSGNNLSFTPKYLGKAKAAAYFLSAHVPFDRGSFLLLGLGDSFQDLELLSMCDYQIVPSQSQLGRRR